MRIHSISTVLFAVAASSLAVARADDARFDLLKNSPRIVFLGDSITASGVYVAQFDAWLATKRLASPPVVIDAGLSSETVSGLSEEGHAGGKFPRPDLHERLDRVLAATKPNLVFACYGINCGIYQPFDAERFARYQAGYRKLKEKVESVGAKLIVVTPPFYDDSRKKAGDFSYNEVLDRYAAWLVGEREQGWTVVDLHKAMTDEVVAKRKTDPTFHFQRDAVHPGPEGHWFIARQLIRWFGDEESASAATPDAMLAAKKLPPQLLELCQKRTFVLRDAYVGAAGHKRPGVAAGLPIPEAEAKYRGFTDELQKLLSTASR